jgi:hypothetical protein
MPSLLNTVVTANYLKTSPSTQFGTRGLRIIKITADNGGDSDLDFTAQSFVTNAFVGSYTDSASYYSLAVRAVQTVAEIYAIGQPDATSFIAVIADNTANDSDTLSNVPGGWGDLEAAIQAAVQSKIGNKAGGATLVNSTITVTAIDVASGASNFVGGAIGSLV